MSTPGQPATGRFARGSEGQWMLLVPREMWAEGAEVPVALKNGATKTVICGDWFEEKGDCYLAAFTDPTPRPAPTRKAKAPNQRARAQHTTTARSSSRPGDTITPRRLSYLTRLIRDNTINGVVVLDSASFPAPSATDIAAMTNQQASAMITQILEDQM